LGPNHGKMIGMPPRTALPAANTALGLVNSIGRSPGGAMVAGGVQCVSKTL
jgi:hypothetical protein